MIAILDDNGQPFQQNMGATMMMTLDGKLAIPNFPERPFSAASRASIRSPQKYTKL